MAMCPKHPEVLLVKGNCRRCGSTLGKGGASIANQTSSGSSSSSSFSSSQMRPYTPAATTMSRCKAEDCREHAYTGKPYCREHMCDKTGCESLFTGEYVPGKKQYCDTHASGLTPAQEQGQKNMERRAQVYKIVLATQSTDADKLKKVSDALNTIVGTKEFVEMYDSHTSIMDHILAAAMPSLLQRGQYKQRATTVNGMMCHYSTRGHSFAEVFCQDLLLCCYNKIESADISYIVSVTSMVAFPLLGPVMLAASSSVTGAIAQKAVGYALDAAKSATTAGATAAGTALNVQSFKPEVATSSLSTTSQNKAYAFVNFFTARAPESIHVRGGARKLHQRQEYAYRRRKDRPERVRQ